jgi:hypothetical protein
LDTAALHRVQVAAQFDAPVGEPARRVEGPVDPGAVDDGECLLVQQIPFTV